MFFPAIFPDVYDIRADRLNWRRATPTRVASILIVVSLIGTQLVRQVSRGPKEGLIQ
jgi:hypothetical protein